TDPAPIERVLVPVPEPPIVIVPVVVNPVPEPERVIVLVPPLVVVVDTLAAVSCDPLERITAPGSLLPTNNVLMLLVVVPSISCRVAGVSAALPGTERPSGKGPPLKTPVPAPLPTVSVPFWRFSVPTRLKVLVVSVPPLIVNVPKPQTVVWPATLIAPP